MNLDDEPAGDQLLAHLEETARWVAFVTGVKQQLIDAGWSARAAEKLTHALVATGGSG